MSQTQRRRLCYALGISITLVMTGFLGFGMRAFVTADASGFLIYASLGVLVTALSVYFILQRNVVEATKIHKGFEGSLQQPSFGKDRRRPALAGQERVEVTIERRGKQRSGRLAAQSE